MKLRTRYYNSFVKLKKWPFVYRPGTSDESVMSEVLERHIYRRPSVDFDVEEGEHWLDLGANIGSFALYCKMAGATVECYEPDPECFKLLKRNARGFKLFPYAVTKFRERKLEFWKGMGEKDFSRATIIHGALPAHPSVYLANRYAGFLLHRRFNGVKMDIEGSEFGLIDNELLPRCEKLVLEYHFLRYGGDNARNFFRRMRILKKHFKHVWYPSHLKTLAKKYGNIRPHLDRLVFCWGAK